MVLYHSTSAACGTGEGFAAQYVDRSPGAKPLSGLEEIA
jgi:hypothetical protein